MKILVTGATGFIGNYVIQKLVNMKNYDIIATSLEPEDKVRNFNWYKYVEYISCDLNEKKENFFSFFKEPEILIHLAWQGLPNFKELYHFERNVHINYFFIKNLILNGLENVNIIGTCLEYGMKSGRLTEDIETNPITAYGLAKDTLRKYLQEFKKKKKFLLKWIRLFYTYGKGQTPKSIIPQLNIALDSNQKVFNMSGGEQLRDYLPVETVADYIVKISIQKEILGLINCCSGKPISIKKLVETHLQKRNKTIMLNLGYYPYPDYVHMSFWGDNSKMNKIILKRE